VNRVFGAFAVLSAVGVVGLALTALAGFEEPNNTLLLVSAALVLAAPVAMLSHVSVTSELTRQEKRAWIRRLASARAPRVFAEYLTCPDRRAAGRSLSKKN